MEAFAELGRSVVGEVSLGQVLARAAELAGACIPGAEEVSVTLLEGGAARTVAFTGRLAATWTSGQYQAGFGPCLDAAENGQTIRLDDTGAESTYPAFAAVAARQGVRSVISVDMPMPQRILGGLNVYRFDDGVLSRESQELLQVFAGYAAVALANHSLYASAVALSANLQTAMQSRAVIEQAKGVLVARLRCTPEEAFSHMVEQPQRANRKLRDIAADTVAQAARNYPPRSRPGMLAGVRLVSASGSWLRLEIDGHEFPQAGATEDDAWDANWLFIAGTVQPRTGPGVVLPRAGADHGGGPRTRRVAAQRRLRRETGRAAGVHRAVPVLRGPPVRRGNGGPAGRVER